MPIVFGMNVFKNQFFFFGSVYVILFLYSIVKDEAICI